jgi:hypothetical protein
VHVSVFSVFSVVKIPVVLRLFLRSAGKRAAPDRCAFP